MKRILSVLFALILIFALSACKDNSPAKTDSDTSDVSINKISTEPADTSDENTAPAENTAEDTDSVNTTAAEITANKSEEPADASDENIAPAENTAEDTDSVNTTAAEIIANKSEEPAVPKHTHSFSTEATCTEPKKCACGATEGSALGHKYEYFVCIRCNAVQQGDFVNLKDYFWKYGEEIVNLNVPGKEASAPYEAELKIFDFYYCFLNESSCNAWVDPAIKDINTVYNSPNTDVKARIYNSKVYSAAAEANCDFTYVEEGSYVKITFKGEGEGSAITFEKRGVNELVVVYNTSSKLQNISVGTVFKAYPRWEIFAGAVTLK